MNKPPEIKTPTVEVRRNGELIARVDRHGAMDLIERGWVGARGSKCVKYLALLPEAPLHQLRRSSWRGCSHTTRPIRADQTCLTFGAGQLMGNSRCLREHIPIPS